MTEKFYKLNQLISQIVTAVPDMASLLKKTFWHLGLQLGWAVKLGRPTPTNVGIAVKEFCRCD